MLGGHHGLRKVGGRRGVPGPQPGQKQAHGRRRVGHLRHGGAGHKHVAAVAERAGVKDQGYAFAQKKLVAGAGHGGPALGLAQAAGLVGPGAAAGGGHGRIGQVQQLLVGLAAALGLKVRLQGHGGAVEHDFAFQLTAVFFQVGGGFGVYQHHFGVGQRHARRPGFGKGNERHRLRRGHFGAEALQRPAPAEGAPAFEVGVLQAVFRKFVAGPLVGPLQGG